jgi:hypothetical protein
MISSDWRTTASLGVLEAELVVNRPGMGTLTFQLSGTFSATVTFEATDMNGASPSWVAIPAVNVTSGASATTATAAGIYRILASGYQRVRARCSTYGSGSVDVVAVASYGNTVSGGSVAIAGAVDTELPAAAALGDAASNPTAPGVGAFNMTWNGATWDRMLGDTAGRISNAPRGSASTLTDALSNAPTIPVAANGTAITQPVVQYMFNGTTWDRERGNIDVTGLASAARTTIQTINVTNHNGRGIHVVLNVTSAGTGSITLSIVGVDSVSAATYTILAGAAVTTNSTNVYKVGQGLTAAANAVANDLLPRSFNIVITHNNANTITYSVGYSLVTA